MRLDHLLSKESEQVKVVLLLSYQRASAQDLEIAVWELAHK